MAEIKIEKKKPIWPWILLILIILGIVAYFVYANDLHEDHNDDFDDDVTDEQMLNPTDTTDGQMNTGDTYDANNSYGSSYDEYAAFEESMRDSTRIAIDSSYTKKAFANLAKVVVKKADENNLEDSKALGDLRNFSVLMTGIANANSDMDNFKNFKTAADKVASVLGDIQSKNFPSMQQEVANLKESASKISVSTTMDKQQTEIYAFLKKSRDVLKDMNL